MKQLLTILAATALLACNKTKMDDTTRGIGTAPPGTGATYLALGDSYTIGESVLPAQSFPYQLAVQLNNASVPVSTPVIVARTGWTTDELIAAIKERNITQKFDFVTLLIGVNNQYRGYSTNTYRSEFIQLLNTAIAFARGNAKHVFVVSIPDWGVTPYAEGQNREEIAKQIDQFNGINKAEADKAGVNYTNITPISRQALQDQSLTAEDGLHPSGKMYGLWVEQLAPQVTTQLSK